MAATKAKKPAPAKAKKPAKTTATAEQKPKPDYDSPEALAKYDAASHQLLTQARESVEAAQRDYLASKQTTADAKKTMEAAQIDFQKIQADRNRYRGKQPPAKQLTFDDMPATNEEAIQRGKSGKSPAVLSAGNWFPDDLVFKYPIAQWVTYGLHAKDVEAMREGVAKAGRGQNMPITIYGDIALWMQPNKDAPEYTRNLSDIKGIGPEGATRINDAEERFLKAWKDGGLAELFAREKGYTPPTAESKTEDKPPEEKPKKAKGKVKENTPPVAEAEAKPEEKPEAND